MFSQVHARGRGRLAPEFISLVWPTAAVGAATIAGLAIRLYRLAAEPLSSQEIYTWDFAHQSIPFILGPLAHIETNPPFYYLLIKFVMQFGESEFLFRLPSVIAGTLAIPLIYVLGRLGGAPKSGVIGAWLLSLSTIAISYSREARAYALLMDACLLAAIGAVMIIRHYSGDGCQTDRSRRWELPGWYLFTGASIIGFYLHYTFTIEIFVLECAIVTALCMEWFSGKIRVDRALVVKWLLSSLAIVFGIAWGLSLARGLARSDNITWMHVPSLREALWLVINVDTFNGVSRFQPLPNFLLFGLAAFGLIVGWRRSSAVLVCGALFALFPMVLFILSQSRPAFIERSLVAPSFAACLLASHGTLSLIRKLSAFLGELLRRYAARSGKAPFLPALTAPSIPVASTAFLALFGLGAISAFNTIKPGIVLEPYDKVAEYLASAMQPGDAAVGTDGVIYYRQQIKASFPYFKLVEGETSESRITYGSPTVSHSGVTKLARAGHSVYLVLRETIGLVVNGKSQTSYAAYVLDQLEHHKPPIASFGTLGVYKLKGECADSAPCL